MLLKRLQEIEKNVDKAEIFDLLSYLRELSRINTNSLEAYKYDYFIEGLIERIQERIVLRWYK